MYQSFQALDIRDQDYPSQLREIYNPPKALYFKGDIQLLNKTCISIIGTRKNTEYGERMTKKIVEDLSVIDCCIVSGLAKGIDTIAHIAALENNMPTIAVLGSGIDNVYPKQNIRLSEKIIQNGLLLSEYPSTTEPFKFNFPQRNRIVSGISIATIVIEAPERSGALITAKLALDQGKEIFALPGDVDRPKSIGAIRLIQNSSAHPITSGLDVIDVLRRQPHLFPEEKTATNHQVIPLAKESLQYNLEPNEEKIIQLISSSRLTSLTQIIKKTGITTQSLLAILSILEIKNLIINKGGKYRRRLKL